MMARRLATVAIALALVLGAAGCGDRFGDDYADRFDSVRQDLRAERARAAPPGDFAGLTAEDVFAAASPDRAAILALQRAMGFGLLRQTFDWRAIERRPGQFRTRVYDRFVLDAAERGVRILPILFNPPAFRARRTSARGTPPPEDPASMARFATAMVERYGPEGSLWRRRPQARKLPIRSWQIWNEPNVPVYWPPRPDAGEYAELLEVVARAIKAADPRAEVVSAGLPNSRLGVPFTRYLRQLYAAGAGDSIDTLAIHPYARTSAGVLAAVRGARRRLRALGAGRTPIWITEMGWASGGPDSPFTVGARDQAAYVREAIAGLSARRRADRIRGFVYFNWRDARPYMGGRDFWGLHTGLIDLRGRRKPAFDTVRGVLLRTRAGGR